MNDTNPTDGAAAGTATKQVLLQKFFLKDASLELPNAPAVFARPWQPQVDVQVNTEVKHQAEESWQVTLSVTVTAKLGADVAFLCEVHYAGLFLLRAFADRAELQAVLGAYCPSLIFPFARETVADLVQRAGFPQLLLQPINFEALYLEHVNRRPAPEVVDGAATH